MAAKKYNFNFAMEGKNSNSKFIYCERNSTTL